MNKLMALDIGTKRIGIALSDYLQIIATGYSWIERDSKAIEKIKQIATENNVKKIIVGVPINMDGTEGFQAENCLEFSKNFENDFEIIHEDERLTSEQAEENLRTRNINYKKDKGLVDIESACIILEQYINRKK